MIENEDFNYEEYAERWSYHRIEKILQEIKDKLNHLKVNQEFSISFLFAASFAKALTTFEEILTLIYFGYPNGALALSRNLYENFVLMFFIDVYHKSYPDLPQKFIDTYEFEAARLDLLRYEDILKSITEIGIDIANINELKDETIEAIANAKNRIDQFKAKYPSKNYKDYWWASDILTNQNFNEIQNKLINDEGLPRSFRAFYKYACGKVHCSLGIYGNLGDLSEDIVYSQTFDGYEIPLGFSLNIFMWYVKLFFMQYHHIAHESLVDELCSLAKGYVSLINGVS